MHRAVLLSPEKLAIETIPTPVPGAGDVLVRVHAATTCGTDLKAYLRGHPQIPMPGPFGHEYSGTVAAVGEGAPFSIGDGVMGVHTAPCGNCRWCICGQENLCETIMSTKLLGTYAEYVLIPRRIASRHLFLKPNRLSFAEAALLEPLACVMQGIDQLKPKASEHILIIGPGAIGLMFVAALKAMGVKHVAIAGRNPNRLRVAEEFGAVQVCLEEANGFDATVEATGQREIWEKSPSTVRRGGRVLFFGGLPSGTEVSFNATRVHYDQIQLVHTFHFGTNAVKSAFHLLSLGKVDFARLISGHRSLNDLVPTLEDLRNGIGLKYVITPIRGTEQ